MSARIHRTADISKPNDVGSSMQSAGTERSVHVRNELRISSGAVLGLDDLNEFAGDRASRAGDERHLMLNQMMSPRSARRPHSQGSPSPNQSQGVPGQGRSGARRNAVAHRRASTAADRSGPPGASASERKDEARTSRGLGHRREKILGHDQVSPEAHGLDTSVSRRTVKNGSQRHVMTDQSMISLLRTTHRRLESADHDYQGHRVKAMNHIASALTDLGSTSVGNSSVSANAGNLPQSRSDEILRDAMFQLRTAETSLGTGTDRGERHHRARSAVAHAVHELVTALEIR